MEVSTSPGRLVLASLAGFLSGIAGVAVVVFAFQSSGLFNLPVPVVMVVLFVALFGPAVVVARSVVNFGSAKSAAAAEGAPLAPALATPLVSGESPVASQGTIDAPPASPPDAVVRAIALAQAPPAKPKTSPLLLGALSLGAYVLFDRRTQSLELLALLVLVLLFHEAGHLAGMRLFGYRDLRMLFVPFVGALASGKKNGAPGWQQAIVLLLGPLPGLVLSMVVLISSTSRLSRDFANQLLFINGLNLFPLVPLDGGRFMAQLFARRPRLQAAFSATSLVVFGVFAYLGASWFLVGIAAFFLAMVPFQLRVANEGAAVRAAWGTVPPLSDISQAAAQDLYNRALALSRAPAPQPPLVASLMRQVHERALTEPVSPPATLGLLFAYGAGFVLIAVDLLMLTRAHR